MKKFVALTKDTFIAFPSSSNKFIAALEIEEKFKIEQVRRQG
jgi:hypothetical protein